LAKYRGGPPAHAERVVERHVEHARPSALPPPLPTEEELDVQLEQKVHDDPIHYPPEKRPAGRSFALRAGRITFFGGNSGSASIARSV